LRLRLLLAFVLGLRLLLGLGLLDGLELPRLRLGLPGGLDLRLGLGPLLLGLVLLLLLADAADAEDRSHGPAANAAAAALLLLFLRGLGLLHCGRLGLAGDLTRRGQLEQIGVRCLSRRALLARWRRRRRWRRRGAAPLGRRGLRPNVVGGANGAGG